MKTNNGSIWYDKNGALYARITFTDGGKRKSKVRRAENITEARKLCKQMLRELEEGGKTALDNSNATFDDLADYYAENYLVSPTYAGGRKVHGLKTYKQGIGILKVLRKHFGKRPVREITYGEIERFKLNRVLTPVEFPNAGVRDRSIASVNRELSLLRRLFKVAEQERWIVREPFSAGKSLISLADEVKRERVLSDEEEILLLAECPDNLKAIVIMAIDTGMRKGEILTLKISDIGSDSISIRDIVTKTGKGRKVPISNRLNDVLAPLILKRRLEGNDCRLFEVAWINKSWANAVERAGIEDLHFHDLRGTFATRLLRAGIPLAEVSKLLGHSNVNTTYQRYIRPNEDALNQSREILNNRSRVAA